MHRPYAQTNFCYHENYVHCDRSSTIVCLECGIVLEDVFSYSAESLEKPSTISEVTRDEFQKLPNKFYKDIYDFIENCCQRMFLAEYLIKEIYQHFTKTKKKHSCKNNQHLAAFCIYDYLKRNNLGKHIHRISNITGVKDSIILKCESSNPDSLIVNDVPSIMNLIQAKCFNLTYSDIDNIISLSFLFEDRDYNPYVLSAALTAFYCKAMKDKIKNLNNLIIDHFTISMNGLCRVKKDIKKIIKCDSISILETVRHITQQQERSI